jgi:hypothetical protein
MGIANLFESLKVLGIEHTGIPLRRIDVPNTTVVPMAVVNPTVPVDDRIQAYPIELNASFLSEADFMKRLTNPRRTSFPYVTCLSYEEGAPVHLLGLLQKAMEWAPPRIAGRVVPKDRSIPRMLPLIGVVKVYTNKIKVALLPS